MQLLAVLATLAVVGSTFGQFPEFTHYGLQAQRLVMSGDPAPGMTDGLTLDWVGGETTFGANGGVAFSAGLAGAGVEYGVNDYVLYSVRAGQLVPVAQRGAPAPGLDPPATFSGTTLFYAGPVNATGDVVFDADIAGRGAGTWVARPQPELLAINGMPAPGTSGLLLTDVARGVSLNNTGHVAFWNRAEPPGDPVNGWNGIWSDRGGALVPVYKSGDPAPAPLTGLTIDPSVLRLTSDDRLVLGALLRGPGVNQTNEGALLAEREGSLCLVARSGDPAPGAGWAVFKDIFTGGFIRTNIDGRVAMRSSLTGVGVTSSNASGIWSEASGPLRLVARKGDPAPGAGAGVTFTTFEALAPWLNSSGQTLFKATVSDPAAPGYSIWLDDAGSLSALVKYGQFAPGFGPNAYFTAFRGEMGINNAGDIIFEATTYDPASLYSTDAVYRMDGGLPKLVISEWQMFDGQMVGGVSVLGLNELRQLGLFVTFVGPDGAAFTSDDVHGYYLVTIPEPATLALLALGAAAMMRRRARV